MRSTTAIGIGAAFAALVLAVLVEGGNPLALLNLPAVLIVFGGTLAATAASTNGAQIKRIPQLYRRAMKGETPDSPAAIAQMISFAEKARREGLLALEKDLERVDDAYTRKGIQLVVDGTDSELVRAILQSEIDGMGQRHNANAETFVAAGGFAPTLGILGTVLSLVHVLENLTSPGQLGHAIAGAFLATLYGVGTANLIYLPVAYKLKELSGVELNYRQMQLEAILSIQAGDNPRMLGEKLLTFLSPDERAEREPAAVAPVQQRPVRATEADAA